MSALGQLEQPHPQELLPFFLSFIIFVTISTTNSKTNVATTIVEILLIIKLINPPCQRLVEANLKLKILG